MKKVTSILILLISVLLLVGCSNTNGANLDSQTADKTYIDANQDGIPDNGIFVLDVWSGKWNGIDSYLENSDMSGTYKNISKKTNMTEEEVKKAVEDRFKNGIASIVLEEDKLTTYKAPQGNTIIESDKNIEATYKFVSQEENKTGDIWYIFEYKDGDAVYPYVGLSKKCATESGTEYFALRYGEDIEEVYETSNAERFPIKVPVEAKAEDVALLIQALY